MRRIPVLLTVSLLFCVVTSSLAELPAVTDLLALVPTDAQIVAGINSPRMTNYPFTIAARSDHIDMNDVVALLAADSARVIRRYVFTASLDRADKPDEHSVMVSGHFDRARIERSALQGGATPFSYDGFSGVAVSAFAREQPEFNEVRWLVIPSPDLVLFGSIATVRQELDRLRSHSAPDSFLVRRLSRMRPNPDTWCFVSEPARNAEISGLLAPLSPQLAGLVGSGDLFQLDVRYANRVEIEFEIATASDVSARDIADSLTPSLVGSGKLVRVTAMNRDYKGMRGIIRISVNRYRAWVEEIARNHGHTGHAP